MHHIYLNVDEHSNFVAVGGQETLVYRVDNKHENWGIS